MRRGDAGVWPSAREIFAVAAAWLYACLCREFLEHQAHAERLLLPASALQEAGFRPQDVVEDVAEALLDELLLAEAEGEGGLGSAR